MKPIESNITMKNRKHKPRRWWYAVEVENERYAPAMGGVTDNEAPGLFDTRDRAEAHAFLDHREKVVQVKLVRRRTGWKGKPIRSLIR